MKKRISLLLALVLMLGCLPALGEGFAPDYAAMNEAAASVLILTRTIRNWARPAVSWSLTTAMP